MHHLSGAMRRTLLLALPLIAASPPTRAVAAPTTPAAGLVETLPLITITADKTRSSLEQVTASVAVMSGQDLERSGVTGLETLEGRLPGLSFQPFGQAGLNSPAMRGLTANFNTFSTAVLLLVDGVPVHTAQGFDDPMIDLARIEVLRGPQSTLYGRNAEAGVIAIHSLPLDSTPRASASAELGSRDKRRLRFSLSQPLADKQWSFSMAGAWLKQEGFIANAHNGSLEDARERRHLKLGLRWTPGPATDLTWRYTRQDYDDGSALWGSPKVPRIQVMSGTPSWNRSKGQSLSLDASHTFDTGLRMRAITAWSDFADDIQQDTDFMPADLMHLRREHRLRSLSQELRFEAKLGATDWLVGAYLDRSDNDLHNAGRRMAQREDLRADQRSQTAALFTHWRIPLGVDWRLDAGVRAERSRVQIAPQGALAQTRHWTSLSPKLALQHSFSPVHQGYLSVTRGIRSGGFNALSPAMSYASFEPEKNWSYEAGLKGWTHDKSLRYALTAYLMRVRGMQVMQMPLPGVMYITSAASARSRGLELEADHLFSRGWKLQAGLAWNRTRFEHFIDGAMSYAGHRNPFAPDLGGHLGIRHETPAGWHAQAQIRGTSKIYLDAANSYRRRGYGLIDLGAGYHSGAWEAAAWVSNAANKAYDAIGYQNGFVTVYSPPREMSLRLSWWM